MLFSSGDPTRDVLTASSLITTQQVAASAVSTLHLDESPDVLLASVTATPVGQSNLVAVTASASSPRRAQQIANAFPRAVIATRAAALHQAIAAILPSLQAQAARLPSAVRNASGSVTDQISQLEDACGEPGPDDFGCLAGDPPDQPVHPEGEAVAGGRTLRRPDPRDRLGLRLPGARSAAAPRAGAA